MPVRFVTQLFIRMCEVVCVNNASVHIVGILEKKLSLNIRVNVMFATSLDQMHSKHMVGTFTFRKIGTFFVANVFLLIQVTEWGIIKNTNGAVFTQHVKNALQQQHLTLRVDCAKTVLQY
jgi:hypothetical protein